MNKILTNSFLIMVVFVGTLLGGKKGADLKFIAVYFGDGTHYDALVTEDYRDFEFYRYTDSPTFRYEEEMKLIGAPTYLPGLYGELPEKMMFSAVNRMKKGDGAVHRYGTIFMLNNGLITLQAPQFGVNIYDIKSFGDEANNKLRSMLKKLKKGKAKIKAAKKPPVAKKSAFGELEPSKGTKLDKKYKKMLGQSVPSGISVIDASGARHDLSDLTAKGPVVLVFFHMNDIPLKKKYLILDGGATKDHPVKPNHKPLDRATWETQFEQTAVDDAEGATSAMGALGMMAKAGVKREVAAIKDDILEGDQDLLPRQAVVLYDNCTAGLRITEELFWGKIFRYRDK